MFRFPFLKRRCAKEAPRPADYAPEERKDQHNLEIAQFKEVLESFGAVRIDERLAILDVFLSTEQHVTLKELEPLLREKKLAGVDRLFLQETMEMFCRFGFAQEITFERHETRYEHHHLGTHHDHFICTRCGRIQEFVNPGLENLQLSIARQFQFHPLQHKLEIYGLCADCMGQRQESIPLSMAETGERVRIVRITGGMGVHNRLAAMGLRLNACLDVVGNPDSGPFIVALNDSRMALGRSIAEHILVAHSCHHQEEKGRAG